MNTKLRIPIIFFAGLLGFACSIISTPVTPTATATAVEAAGVPTPTVKATPSENAAEITIAYSGYAKKYEFFRLIGKGAADEASAKGVDFIDITTDNPDSDAQIAAVNNAIDQGVSAIIIAPVDPGALASTLAKAKAAGIPILAVDAPVDDPNISGLIQTDNPTGAQLAGDYIVQATGGNGKVLIIGGTQGSPTSDARTDGVEAKCRAAGMETIVEHSDFDTGRVVAIVQANLSANPDLSAIFVTWDGGAMSALAEVKQQGLLNNIKIVGFDGSTEALQSIRAGGLAATVYQDKDRMGRESVDAAITLVNGGTIDAIILIPGVIVDQSNVDQYLN